MYPFHTYEAYLDRYRTFWSEEGDGRPGIMDESDFSRCMKLLRESYDNYQGLLISGQEEEAATYYGHVIHALENQLAIADGSDNFLPPGVIDRGELRDNHDV
ncbi:hypothetical protein [Desmospora activa]|uniref:Uncharacterized protein n=1 Tax=Desmospora activa DSM 45169 TaxID=1121389 RepID=A0A2T4ZC17_9BACL|nr:hypothetical protein [Desmospora activa]PTM59451.1 hypothetical protein C8J48_2073 [Desmospora activa DSM 45169]